MTTFVQRLQELSRSQPERTAIIVQMAGQAAQTDFATILTFLAFLSIQLGILNLLPIPVLDGGQMLFATIARLRGRALPANFIMAAQSTFVVLLFSMIIYVSFFDVRRVVRDVQASKAEAAPAAEKTEPAKP